MSCGEFPESMGITIGVERCPPIFSLSRTTAQNIQRSIRTGPPAKADRSTAICQAGDIHSKSANRAGIAANSSSYVAGTTRSMIL